MIEESFPLFTADEEVASERELLKSVEDGPYMQEVKYIIIHCSATRENRDFTVEDLGCAATASASSAPSGIISTSAARASSPSTAS